MAVAFLAFYAINVSKIKYGQSTTHIAHLCINLITVINNILLVKYGALSEYGADIPLAAFVVMMKLFQIVLNIATDIAAGAQPIVGYNYGAKKYDRVKKLLQTNPCMEKSDLPICAVLFEITPTMFIKLFGTGLDGVLTPVHKSL